MRQTQLEDTYGAILGVEAYMPKQVMSDDTAFAYLNAVGPAVVLEHIALGRTHTEIAASYKVPQLAFRRWIAAAVDPDDLVLATHCGADALVTRAFYVMSVKHDTPEEQRSMKSLATQMVQAASCMAPDKWMPSRISGAGGAATAGGVTINVMQAAPAVDPAQQAVTISTQYTNLPPMSVLAPTGPTVGLGSGLPPTAASPNRI